MFKKKWFGHVLPKTLVITFLFATQSAGSLQLPGARRLVRSVRRYIERLVLNKSNVFKESVAVIGCVKSSVFAYYYFIKNNSDVIRFRRVKKN